MSIRRSPNVNSIQVWSGWAMLLACFSARLLAAEPEVRGTWLTTTGPDHINSGFNTEIILDRLRNTGLNTVYVETWKNGYTNFPSPTLASRIGVDRQPSLGTRDLVQETIVHAHRNNLIHVGWFEYGFSSQFIGSGGTPSNALSAHMLNQTTTVGGQSYQGWLLRDQAGRYGNSSNGFAWMNPAIPQVRQFLIGMTLDAVRRYDLDGIQFDDRLAWPREFGWDALTGALYLSETGRNLPSNIDDANFRAWRQSKVAQFAAELYTTLKAEDPNIHVSVSPSVAGFSDTQYNAKWTDWVSQGLFDEYVPQVYRSTYASFQSDLPSNVNPFVAAGRQDDLVVGVRFDGSPAPTPWSEVQQMLNLTRTTAGGTLSGHSNWYSNSVISNQSLLTGYYNEAALGTAAHPKFGEGYRPDAVVAALRPQTSHLWEVTVPVAGNYRVAAKVGSFWTELDLSFFAPGAQTLEIVGASQVELLVSRRQAPTPIYSGDFDSNGILNCADIDALVGTLAAGHANLMFDLTNDGQVNSMDLTQWLLLGGLANLPSGRPYLVADANLDGVVDGSDFGIWNANKFRASARWCEGDFNADGAVDGSDFGLWNSRKFTSSDQGSLVPEPSLRLGLSVLAAGWLLFFRGLRIASCPGLPAAIPGKRDGGMCRWEPLGWRLSGSIPWKGSR